MTGWRAAATAAMLGAMATVLAGCGFTPMYARPGVVGGLSSIQVVAPQTRTGRLLRENLDDALAVDRAAAPVWRLEVGVAERRIARGIRVDDTATRYELALQVDWKLVEISTGRAVMEKSAPLSVTYDAADRPYAGVVAQEDGQARAAALAAEVIRTDLAVWFSTR
jgi:LPS-assembly lipoprotein